VGVSEYSNTLPKTAGAPPEKPWGPL